VQYFIGEWDKNILYQKVKGKGSRLPLSADYLERRLTARWLVTCKIKVLGFLGD